VSELLDLPLGGPAPESTASAPADEAAAGPDLPARGGPFRAGDRVQLTDPKGRH
jgi:tRNA (adenine57-N1/adenine58-N1)-methyltransferase